MLILLENIVKKDYCLGCGLCVSIAKGNKSDMELSPNGFLIPKLEHIFDVNEMAIVRDICPGINVKQELIQSGDEKIYGNYKYLYVANSKDKYIRYKASSGGCITGLLVYMIDNYLVDGVLHIGKDEKNPLKSCAYVSRCREDIIARSGSRYCPSSLLSELIQILSTGIKIAVVGKPCDIVGVSQFLKKYPHYEKQIIYKISFMCMGMPSQNATYDLIYKMGASEKDVTDFWYRGNGWPGSTTAKTVCNNTYELSYADSWGKVLSKNIHFRCKICPDGYGEFADISCGDAWVNEKGRPCFDDKPGRSLAFIRTNKGDEIFKKAVDAGYIEGNPFDVDELQVIQESQYNRKVHIGIRIVALKMLGERHLRFSGFSFASNLRKGNAKSIIKNFLGTMQRRLFK